MKLLTKFDSKQVERLSHLLIKMQPPRPEEDYGKVLKWCLLIIAVGAIVEWSR